MKYFGTDGIRGKIFEDVDHKIAFDCGNSLCALKSKPRIIIGKDTRLSNDYLTLAFSLGVLYGGGTVVDLGICPTPGVAYLTKHLGFDFGVMISASHNPPDNNGIKVFNSYGQKLGDILEQDLENHFGQYIKCEAMNLKNYIFNPKLVRKYIDFLQNSIDIDLKNLKIVLDCCHGASCKVAPTVFRKLGAKVFVINSKMDGEKINVNCGATNTRQLQESVKNHNADIGLAFDGDSDRLIAVDENGDEVDGDKIIYVLAKQLKKENKLKNDIVIGTLVTNLGIQKQLNKHSINIALANIGDKYVIEKMLETNSILGGEKSGHIILLNHLPTGDGILAGIQFAGVLKRNNCKFSALCDVKLYPQVNISIKVKDKDMIFEDKTLKQLIDEIESKNNQSVRVLVRKSGTEKVIRVMVESEDEKMANTYAKLLEKKVREIDDKNIKK